MAKPVGFEQSLERLEAIVAELERVEQPLDYSLKLFEEGMTLVEECRKQLDAAEGRVEMLVKRAGAVVPEPFTLKDDAETPE
ncbi:MAG TPA: exodeoxyribonuclease VII small subunit [Terriglobales bacterium]|nr:exodeoxyribonuclease VII small subunit [Terriglobales bacterium]